MTNLRNLLHYRSEYGTRELDYNTFKTIYATHNRANIIGDQLVVGWLPNKAFTVVLTDAPSEEIIATDDYCIVQNTLGEDLVEQRHLSKNRKIIKKAFKPSKVDLNKEAIIELYVTQGMGIHNIAVELELSESTLRKRLAQWGYNPKKKWHNTVDNTCTLVYK